VVQQGDGEFWRDIWAAVADAISGHVNAGRAHLLTEDTLRFATIRSLEAAGVPAARMKIEWPMRELGRGKLDLLVHFDNGDRAAVEFKYPRDARGPISPDTMTLGEMLSDFHRVARLPVRHRWVVQLVGHRLRSYLTRVANRHPIMWPAGADAPLTLTGAAIAGLPGTARNSLREWAPEHDVVADCTAAIGLPGQLTLFAFHVALLPGVEPEVAADAGTAPIERATGSARQQFLAAAQRLRQQTGKDTFRRQDLIHEVVRTGTDLSLSTLGQMITVHLCVAPGDEGYGKYSDFERVGHGLFRLRTADTST
jgi:hypothetical protein